MSLRRITQCFSPGQIVQLFVVASILERQVLFTGDSIGTISSCAETLRLLLFPLRWAHVYVPVLPLMLVEAIQAPTPYIMGLLYGMGAPHGRIPRGVLVANTDEGTIHRAGDGRNLLKLPPTEGARLQRGLRALLSAGSTEVLPMFSERDRRTVRVHSSQLAGKLWGRKHDLVLRGLFWECVRSLLARCSTADADGNRSPRAKDTAGEGAAFLLELKQTQALQIYLEEEGRSSRLALGPSADLQTSQGLAQEPEADEVQFITLPPSEGLKRPTDSFSLAQRNLTWSGSPCRPDRAAVLAASRLSRAECAHQRSASEFVQP
uniref:Stomatal cytokinesis-defective 1 family protein n=1 Tax=Tetraselmis sp. GSL018 TaxID=582737 RepID=A0A061QLT2_9CHLO